MRGRPARDRGCQPGMSEHPPETSVVIRALNEERWLPEVLAQLERQRYRDFEIMLVDSGSVDRTRDIAAADGARIVRLRSEDFTFGHSLNVGIREARGTFIAIVSAHAIPLDENWLEQLVAPLRQDATAMVYGGQSGHAVSKFSEARDFERQFPSSGHIGRPGGALRQQRQLRRQARGLGGASVRRGAAGSRGHRVGQVLDGAGPRRSSTSRRPASSTSTPSRGRRSGGGSIGRAWRRAGSASRSCGTSPVRSGARSAGWPTTCGWRRRAARCGRWPREIVRFRYEKTVGTVGGIVDSRGLDNPARRSEIFFQRGFPAVVVRGPNNARLEERGVRSLKPGEVLLRVGVRRHLRHRSGGAGRHPGLLPIGQGAVSDRARATSRPAPSSPSARASPASTRATASSSSASRAAASARPAAATTPSSAASGAKSGVMGHDGAYATYLVTRARYVHRVPDSVTLAQAALAEPLAVVHKALRRLGSQPQGDRPQAMRRRRRRHHRPADGTRPGAARPCRDGVRSPAGAAVAAGGIADSVDHAWTISVSSSGSSRPPASRPPCPRCSSGPRPARRCCCSACPTRTRSSASSRSWPTTARSSGSVGSTRRGLRRGAGHARADRHHAVPGRVLRARGVRKGVERRPIAERAQGHAAGRRQSRVTAGQPVRCQSPKPGLVVPSPGSRRARATSP